MIENCNFNLFSTFLALIDAGSFSDCAKALGKSQPSISRQIRELEEQLSTQLFLRDRHRVELTRQGRRLKQQVEPLFSGLTKAISDIRQRPKELGGTLRFGSLAEAGQSTFMKMTLRFLAQHPGVSIEIRYLEEPVIYEQLRNGTLDFGVLMEPGTLENLKSYRLLDERIVLVTSAKHAIPPPEKKKDAPLKWVGYRPGDPLIELFRKRYPRLFPDDHVAYSACVNSHRSIFDALLATESFAVVPYLSARALVDTGKLRIVPGYEILDSLYLAHYDNPHLSPRDREFKTFLIQECRSLAS